MGKCNKVWLKEFYHSASGGNAQDWIGKTKKADRLPWPGKRGVKVLFPTLRTVRESKLGEAVSLLLSSSKHSSAELMPLTREGERCFSRELIGRRTGFRENSFTTRGVSVEGC